LNETEEDEESLEKRLDFGLEGCEAGVGLGFQDLSFFEKSCSDVNIVSVVVTEIAIEIKENRVKQRTVRLNHSGNTNRERQMRKNEEKPKRIRA
jgi:hypothetical protein